MISIRKRKFSFSYLLAGMVITSAACNSTQVPSEEEAAVITPVTIVQVAYKSITEAIDLPAVSVFLNKSIVRSTTTGTVESISVVIGDNVKKGQVVYIIKTLEAAALNNSFADSALAFKGRINIAAPKEGVITSVSHQNGDFVQEGDELAIISEQNSLVFILDTPFEFVKYIELNRTCKILLPDGKIISGTISGRLPEMDSQAQTVRFVIRPVLADRLPGNLNAHVNIVTNTRTKAAVLPKSAVLGNETLTEFWVMKLISDTTAVKVKVTKGFENNNEVEIADPLFLKSDRIILTGSYGLPDTARVIIK